MKKATKILVIIFIIMLIISSSAYATPIDIVESKISADNIDLSQAKTVRNRVLFLIQLIGSIIAVSMLTVLGIKYMMASPDGKAEIKKQAIIYIAGAVLLFGAVSIVEIIKQFGTSL